MSDYRKLSEGVLASPQIEAGQLAEAKALGVVLVVNNRPDGEEAGQPSGEEIARAAQQVGVDYVAIPIDRSGYSMAQVEAMSDALEKAQGKVLAYCRTGTRSTFLWALASASAGRDPDELVRAAAAAGYDLAPIEPMLHQLAARATG